MEDGSKIQTSNANTFSKKNEIYSPVQDEEKKVTLVINFLFYQETSNYILISCS